MYELELNIIKKIKDGDINAFEQIVDKYRNKALTLSMRILKNREEAEDSLQEAFVKAFRAIVDRKFEGRSKFSTYFYSIVYNTALDSYKKLKTRTYNLINIEDTFSRSGMEEGTGDISAFEMKLDKSKLGQHGHYPAEKELLDNESAGACERVYGTDTRKVLACAHDVLYQRPFAERDIGNPAPAPRHGEEQDIPR